LSREAGWDDKARAAGGGMDADRFRPDTDVRSKTPAQPARSKGTTQSPGAITDHRGHWIPAFAGMTIKSKVVAGIP
jgi:hypothetical protein